MITNKLILFSFFFSMNNELLLTQFGGTKEADFQYIQPYFYLLIKIE